jgi:hypothetical protein
MKTIKFLAMALVAMMTVACQGDWDEPTLSYGDLNGNNNITDDNIITIAQLKTKYPNVFASTDKAVKIEEDIKIKGRVSGNDIGSNIYKQFFLQDETGSIIISVNQSGMHGFLAEGQELIIDLNGLYIGGYRKMPQVGAKYGSGIGRMNKEVFQQHFKYVGTPDVTKIDTLKFASVADFIKLNKDLNCGQLVRIEGVEFKAVEGLGTFAPDSIKDPTVASVLKGGCVSRELVGYTANQIVVRTSTYAKFAARKLPSTKGTIVGMATRFVNGSNDIWQIMIRKESDIDFPEE